MGIKERRKREIQSRKIEILEAAEALFEAKGYGDATMDEIARQAELSKGTLYLYYKTKEEIYLSICVKGLKIMLEKFREASLAGSTGLEKIELIGRAYIDFGADYPFYFGCQVHFETNQYEALAGYKIFQDHIACTAKINTAVFEAVSQGIKDGSVRPGLQPEMTGMMLWAFSSGFIHFVLRNEDEFANYFAGGREQVLSTFFDLLRKGIQA